MYQTPKFAGAFRYNAQKNRATLLCRACLDEPICVAVMYLTLRTGCERYGRKNPLPYSFSERSHIGNLRQIRKQGKGRSSKRKENRRLSFLFAPPRRAPQRSRRPQTANPPAEVQRKTSRPERANPPAAVRASRLSGAEKEPPRQGEPACGSSRTPLSRCRKSGKSRKNFPARKGSKNAHSHAEKTPIRTV